MTRKNAFSGEWSWFKVKNLELALGTDLKFYTSVAKGLKLKVRESFGGLIPTFVETTVERLVGGPFCHPFPTLMWLTPNGCRVDQVKIDGEMERNKTKRSTYLIRTVNCA